MWGSVGELWKSVLGCGGGEERCGVREEVLGKV